MPKISIIIPVYNHAKELHACLASLKEQSLKDFEVIVVDDGSKEPVVISASEGAHIELLRFEANRGAPAARNKGFSASSGSFVIFLDADAILEPEALSKMLNALHQHQEASFAYPSFYWGQKLFKGKVFEPKALEEENYIHTSALIRREAFPGFDETLTKFQDWDLFLRMTHAGKTGVWIPEPLYRIKPRREGMSRWLPRFVQHLPWDLIGWMPSHVRKYREAKKIIQEKNHLRVSYDGEFWDIFRSSCIVILLIELLSAAVIFHPDINSGVALCIGMLMLLLAWRNPAFALAVLAGELVIGSKGALFKFGGDAANDGGVPIRIIIFASFFIAWGAKAIIKKQHHDWPAFLKGRTAYAVLAALLFVAFVRGMLHGSPYVFADANAWGFLLLLLPILDLVRRKKRELKRIVPPLILAALFYVSLKTIALFYFFSHDFGNLWEPVYLWVRRTGVGEVTKITEGSTAFRVFFQSHIYEVLACIGLLWVRIAGKGKSAWTEWLLALCAAVILISFSRSLWLGAFAGSAVAFYFFLRETNKPVRLYEKLKIFLRGAAVPIFAGMLLVVGALLFPLPQGAGGSLADLLRSRADLGEEAAVSRWSLLPAMWGQIRKSPALGQGFGAAVTYQSSDPRVVAATGGTYTTYAFEWGWVDFWLKFGILGIPLMLWIMFSIGWRLKRLAEPWIAHAGIMILVAIGVTHFFTPYLNHPLGFAILLAGEGLIEFLGKKEADS